MKRIILVISAILGFKVVAAEAETHQISCEEKLSQRENENLFLQRIIYKSSTGTKELSANEKQFIYNLVKNARLEDMTISHECEIAK